ncbi:PREDICTED: uncharacterized protein LOC104589062 [Nelumbo nucifera]|uniref:Uncharacterized protein LOC104589062 n=1 Tax=Nelumbo nucifera TaxID=4432 RepID=A0A1U7YY82_NELNU|nr:PREDICTED: uncharacterized protein LOC104589062 [Nelumbo nucifera]
MSDYSPSFPSCFRPSPANFDDHHSPAPLPLPPPTSGNANLTTCLYYTNLGVFALTWCRNVIGRDLQIDIRFDDQEDEDLFPSYRLHMKPFFFWRKYGSKRLHVNGPTKKKVEIYWDLTRAKFVASSPEPQSGFYVAVVVDGVMTLLVGDSQREVYGRSKTRKPNRRSQVLISRREHVFGNKVYTTRARFGGKTRDISIDCSVSGDEPRLCFSVDRKRVLQIKRLKWKFRGNERIEVDGVPIQVSWDVYNWLFEGGVEDGHAVFMFKFEKTEFGEEEEENVQEELNEKTGRMVVWKPQQSPTSGGIGMNTFEWKRINRGFLKTTRSSSSSSMSSASSGCSSSVMEWASSMDESELQSPSGFCLLVYAWRN